MMLRIQESDDKITAKSFKELINKLEAHGYSCGRYYDVNPESNWLYIHKDGNPYEAEFYRYRDGEYELYLHNIHPTKQESYAESYEDSDEDNEGYEYIESKTVYDSDGFMTDYTMYYDHYEGRYIFVLGDKDVYNPMNTYSDWTCDTQEEAYEWFDSYNGFEDDLEDEYIDESLIREAMDKLLYASDLDIEDKLVIPNDKYSFVITDNGCYDLTKKGIYPVYTWVGKQHSSSRSLTPKQLDKLESFVYNIVVPAMAKYCNVDEKDVKVNDFTNSTDMYRVWVNITDKKENESCKKKSKKKSMREYVDEVHGVIKCVETGEEYGYSSLVDREWIIADLVDKGYTYKDRPVRVETGYNDI